MGPMKGRVLVVDDDAALAEMLGIVLRGEGFEPTIVSDGDKAVEVFRDSRPDLVLLDLMLPGSDGIDVCRQIRAESGVPIVMLTAKTDTVDVVLGLESGADDYVMKPFKPKELVARIRARLRRTETETPEILTLGPADSPVTIDVPGHAVSRDGQRISLTPLEFDLLVALARKRWNRSLQLRVIVTTMVLSALVAGLLGWTMYSQVRHQLLTSQRDSALAEADAGYRIAAPELATPTLSTPDTTPGEGPTRPQ